MSGHEDTERLIAVLDDDVNVGAEHEEDVEQNEAKGDISEKANGVREAPKDPWNVAYIIFYWLGMGSLLPWNFFISGEFYKTQQSFDGYIDSMIL